MKDSCLYLASSLLTLFLSTLSPAAQAQISTPFLIPPSFPGADQAVTADFNGDGKPDIVNADGTVLLGNGDGTFTAGTLLQVGGPNAKNLIATADFNGDGKPDLVFASPASNTFYVLLGNGDGTFQAPIVTNVASPLSAIIVGDVNGDGKPDVLGVPSISGGLFTYLGKGDGTFSAGVTSGAAAAGALADFNGDGKLDLALASGIQLGNGNGTFQALIPFPSGSLGATVIGDFDGDGKLDFAGGTSGTGSNPGQLQILFGNGDGTFRLGPVQTLPSGTLAGSLAAAAHLNNGGKEDLIGENFPYVQIFKNNGDGTFTAEIIYNLSATYTEFAAPAVPYILVADFNGDGNLDLATDNIVLLGNGDATVRGDRAIPNIGGPFVTADFNKDGHPDIAAMQPFLRVGMATVNIVLNDGKGNLSLANTYTFAAGGMFGGTSLAAAIDVNGDGNADLIFTVSEKGSWSVIVMLGNGDGSFQAPNTFPGIGTGFVTGFAVADLNGDHKPDIVVIAGSLMGSQGFMYVLLNNGDGTFASPVQYYVGTGDGNVVVGDFNNDGKIDVAVADSPGLGGNTQAGIAILLGNADGTFQPATFNTTTLEINGALFASDVNGDGNIDLIVPTFNAQDSTTQTQVFLGNGDGTFTTATPINGTRGVLQAVDFNRDGKIDVVGTDSSGLLVLLLGNGDGTFGNPIPLVPDPVGGLVVADFNGDNRPDIAVPVQIGSQPVGLVWLFNTSGPPTPDFLISATPLKPATLAPGSSATSTITLTSVGGFSGSVALSCSGLPSGANCNFVPLSLSGPGNSALTITTTASTPVGTYHLLVVGTSSSLVHERTVTLTVATSVGVTTVSLGPNVLTFAPQATGTTSSAQTVQLTNTGTAQLIISGISISGANAGDFAQTNGCGTSVVAGASCQINVTFAPTGMGGRTAVISVSDNATGSPQVVALNGTGPDFSITAGSTSSVTVTPGQTASYMISLAPSAGFNQLVALSCSGAPAQSTCTVSPTSVTLNGTAATVSVTVTTTAASSALRLPRAMDDGPGRMNTPILLVLLGMVMLAGLFGWRREPGFRRALLFAVGVVLWAALTITSCGGGSSGSGGGNPGTLAGTYTISVSGTFASGSTKLTRSASLTLVVK